MTGDRDSGEEPPPKATGGILRNLGAVLSAMFRGPIVVRHTEGEMTGKCPRCGERITWSGRPEVGEDAFEGPHCGESGTWVKPPSKGGPAASPG